MTRTRLIVAIVAIVAWFGLKNLVYRSLFAGETIAEQVAATYNGEDGWAVLPVETPPGAWMDPWGVDIFIVPPPSGSSAGDGLIGAFHEPTREEITAISHKIERTLAPAGPSYSAIYRHPSAAATSQTDQWDVAVEDLSNAFERYLYTKNNMRGILLVSSPKTRDLIPPILVRIESDPRLLERFSGVLWLQDSTSVPDINVNCSPVMEGNCHVIGAVRQNSSWFGWVLPNLPRKPLKFEFKEAEQLAKQLTERNTRLSIWLDENAPKPAEPLGGLEDVEVVGVAPIRRPGETDEALAEAELRGQTD